MSDRYPGGIISKTAPVPSGSYATSTASGVWTLDQQAYWKAQSNWPTFGNNLPYVEDVFSTYLYVGNNTGQTITNGIDLAGKGGLVWCKNRQAGNSNGLYDTVRGVGNALISDTNGGQLNAPAGNEVDAFNSNGFSLGTDYNVYINRSGYNHVSWTFRKQPKFFDVVTYTGTGSNTTISHNLGSVPGMIIVKRTDTTSDWQVYHSALANTEYMVLNTTAAKATGATRWNSTTPTSSVFSLGTDTTVNASGGTYVAYIYASNAGGFGTSGTDNVISCGSFTTDGSGNASVTLGYEPQYVMIKQTSSTGSWFIVDIMRGFSNTQFQYIQANSSAAEASSNASPSYLTPNATGFATGQAGLFAGSSTFIYMAIRRPMKVPTDATTVFKSVATTTTGAANQLINAGFAPDLMFCKDRTNGGYGFGWMDRLRGTSALLESWNTDAEYTNETGLTNFSNTGLILSGSDYNVPIGQSGATMVFEMFARRPGFFDEVCYTGTGSATTVTHNLGVAPELVIIKNRTTAGYDWYVWNKSLDVNNQSVLLLNTNGSVQSGFITYPGLQPTATTFRVDQYYWGNGPGYGYVAYLFATCPGVSKVGSYTGNGTTQAIACGFTGGARFVLIKRTDSTGDWYVYDTARGMTTLIDPYLLLNSTAAEAATLGSVTTTTGGFTVNASILAAINTSGGTYIFLAIA